MDGLHVSKAEYRRLSETLHQRHDVRVYKRTLAVLEMQSARISSSTSIDDQVAAFIDHLIGLSNQETLQTSGVRSRKFWLRRTMEKNICSLG